MACAAKQPNEPVQILVKDKPKTSLSEQRLAVCNKCNRNVDGICRTVAAKHGKERAVISHGINRPSVSCPKGKWLSLKIVCPSCDRHILVNERLGFCEWCRIKKNMGRKNRSLIMDDGRDHTVVPSPFSDTPIKNLHYFMYPRYEESINYHLEELRKSVFIFNGKKICCVAIDENTLHEKYEKQIADIFDEVYYVQNNPNIREKAGFITTLQKFRTKNPNEVICFAHAKGQQIHTKSAPLIRLWSETMYETCVRNWSQVKEAMEQGFPVVGSFKSYSGFRTTSYMWHYSGSFWWGRSKEIFMNRRWKDMCDNWWAAESYVGRHYNRDEGYCLFGLNPGNLYEYQTWERLKPELEIWRTEQNVLS